MTSHQAYDEKNLRRTSAGNLRKEYARRDSSEDSVDSAEPLLDSKDNLDGPSSKKYHRSSSPASVLPKALLLVAAVFILSGLVIAFTPPMVGEFVGAYWKSGSRLVVDEVPDHVRPYIVRAYTLPGVRLGDQIYRFPVTGAASDNAFTMISTAAPASDKLGVLPHLHQVHYENFYCLRGRFMLWTERDGNQQARLLTPGDYGAVPTNITHTFQVLDPFTEMVGVISPGGFEGLFHFLAQENYTSAIHAPFPQGEFATPGGNPEIIRKLEGFDVFARFAFQPRRDLVDGAAGEDSIWHTGRNSLAEDAVSPFYVAKDRGPGYLVTENDHKVVQPFITPQQSGGEFTQGTITLSRHTGKSKPRYLTQSSHTAVQVVDGAAMVEIDGRKEQLLVGDVAFVPAHTKWRLWSEVAFAKVLYVGQGSETLDQQLMKTATPWSSAMFPHTAAEPVVQRKRSRIERR